MAENTKIEWAHHTQNWWIGCTQISAACDFCYAKAWAERFHKPELWQGQLQRTSAANWAKPIKWDKEAARLGIRYRVFSNSLSDFFDNQADPIWRRDAWHIIASTRNLEWMLLTKRPQNISKMLPAYWPLSNVWLGTTVENGEEKRRIDHLRKVPAAVRFLSCEPLLEDLGEIDLTGIQLVIVGGESGPHARPMHPDWARSLRDQCAEAGVSFHFKQWGEWAYFYDRDADDPDWQRSPTATRPGERYLNLAGGHGFHGERVHFIRKVGNKLAGRLLDGRTHDDVPTGAIDG